MKRSTTSTDTRVRSRSIISAPTRAKRDDVLRRTTSGGATVNGTLFHFAAENLPFGGVGPSGIGAYHGEFGFQTFSHRKGVFLQSRLSGVRFLYPPFGRLTDLMLKVLNRG